MKKKRLKGDFYHNIKALKTGDELFVIRRPLSGANISPEEFVPCKFCYGFLVKNQLRRHIKNCALRSSGIDTTDEDIIKQAELLLYPNKNPAEGSSVELKEFVIRNMNNNEVMTVVKNDSLLLQYSSFLLCGKGAKRPSDISQ